MLDVVCTHCGKTLKIPEEHLEQRRKCNHCHGEITVWVMLDVICTHCGKTFKIPEEYLEQKGKCNHCHGEITVWVRPVRSSAEVVEPREDENEEFSTFLQVPVVDSKPRAFFRGRRILWVCVLLAAFLSSAILVGCLVGWLVHAKSQRTAGTVSTVTSLAEASRRLELRGYRYVKGPETILGMDIVTYERQADDALFTAEIMRWSGSQPIVNLWFCLFVREEAINSRKRLSRLYNELGSDACAMVNGRRDYLRAVVDMREVKDHDGRFHQYRGQATTSEGWQFTTIVFASYYSKGNMTRKGSMTARMTRPDVNIAKISVTNLEGQENVPLSASLEFNREMEEAKKESKQKYGRGVGMRDETPPPQPTPVPNTTGQWALIAQWEGEAAKNTETFTVGSEWCLDWFTTPDQSGEGNFVIYINSSRDNSLVGIAANVIGANTDVSYQHSAGTYYLMIYTTQPYLVRILEKR